MELNTAECISVQMSKHLGILDVWVQPERYGVIGVGKRSNCPNVHMSASTTIACSEYYVVMAAISICSHCIKII